MDLARKEALAHFNKDQGFRLWGTKHGGVYVSVTKETPPSPYMEHVPERDIQTPSGKALTLLNPAYMVRQLMEDYKVLYGIRGKITGLVVLRPGNAPDKWETAALKAMKGGAKEFREVADIDGRPFLRLMRPMYMEKGCEKCHGHLDFKEGDFRGGVGVAIPLAPYLAAEHASDLALYGSHGFIWFLGLALIGFGTRQSHNHITENLRAGAEIRELNAELEHRVEERTERLRSIADTAADGIITIDGRASSKASTRRPRRSSAIRARRSSASPYPCSWGRRMPRPTTRNWKTICARESPGSWDGGGT